MKNTRKGLGKGLGMGYKNIAPMDAHIHSLSAKGQKTRSLYACKSKTPKKVDARGYLKTFKIDKEYSIVAYSEGTRSGFRHIASLMRNGQEIDRAKATYLNRTWESYEFQSVNQKLLRQHFDEKKANDLIQKMEERKNLYAKGQKDYMKAVVRFEDLNPDYPSSQMEGIVIETGRKFQDPRYINEKIDNTKRFYDGLLDNFGRRIKNPEIQKEFHQKLKEGRLDAMYDLQTRYDGRKSFYGKARVDDTGGKKTLFSYNTKVAEIDYDAPPSKRVKVFGLYSNTTTRHIKDFLQQNGVKVESSKQIIEDYGV